MELDSNLQSVLQKIGRESQMGETITKFLLYPMQLHPSFYYIQVLLYPSLTVPLKQNHNSYMVINARHVNRRKVVFEYLIAIIIIAIDNNSNEKKIDVLIEADELKLVNTLYLSQTSTKYINEVMSKYLQWE